MSKVVLPKWIMFCINMLGVVGVAYWFLLKPLAPEKQAAPQTPPAFEYTTITGAKHSITESTGKVTLIHFWASWCAPCVEEFPQLIALAKNNPEKLNIIALSVDEKQQAIEKFIGDQEIPPNLHIVWDENEKITYDMFQVMNYPETILVGCDFTLKRKILGMSEDWPATVAPLLAECK